MSAKKLIELQMQRARKTPAQMAKCFLISERTWRYWLAKPGERLTAYRLKVIGDVLHLTPAELAEIITEVET